VSRKDPVDTRTRILAAAEGLSCEVGPARMSIEAVAARAGVSKGGLLYHFPTKHDLLRALVQEHVDGMRRAMADGVCCGAAPLAQARAYLRVVREKLLESAAPPGLFAAIAEDPEFIAPIRAFRKAMLDEVFRRCPDPAAGTVVFLACEGMIFGKLTDPQACDRGELGRVLATLDRLLEGELATAEG
jgi:AcrR family transcriptional regulator